MPICGLTQPLCHGRQLLLGCCGTSAGVRKVSGTKSKLLTCSPPLLCSRIQPTLSAMYIIKRVQVLSLIPSRLAKNNSHAGEEYGGCDGRDYSLIMEICLWCWRLFFVLFTLFCLAVIFLSTSDNYIALDWRRSAVCDSSEKPVCSTCHWQTY